MEKKLQITGNAPHPGREKLKVLIEKMEQVPSIPATLSQLLVKMNNTDVTIKEIEQVIKQDPSLAAKFSLVQTQPIIVLQKK